MFYIGNKSYNKKNAKGCEKKTNQTNRSNHIYVLCDINDQITWGEK
jgi:hypothetical protein